MAIDYAAARRGRPTQKRRLTLALREECGEARRLAVTSACQRAVTEWDQWGAWPDDWSRWQRALDDAYAACPAATFPGFPAFAPRLEDLA